jgi:hypothetical protein
LSTIKFDLIRALCEVAGLSIEVVRAVLAQLDRGWDGGDPVGEALRAASFVALPEQDPQAKRVFDAARDEVRRFLSGLDWISTEYEGHLPLDLPADRSPAER